jgi:pSer/pThr/pTyr-binding forkhead associated (FHA) protein
VTVISPDGGSADYPMDREVTIGREPDNGIVLRDPSVSRHHARIFLDRGRTAVEDLGSANGILVGGRAIGQPTVVSEGAEIQIGHFMVTVRSGRATALQGGRRGRPLLAAHSEDEPSYATAVNPGGRPVTAERPDRIPELRKAEGGESFLLGRPAMVVGRLSPADVILDDASVSRRHAELRREGAGFTLRDLGSSNGTFVNDEPVVGVWPLRQGDRVRFGNIDFVYQGPGASLEKRRKQMVAIAAFSAVAVVSAAVILGRDGRQVTSAPAPGAPAGAASLALPQGPSRVEKVATALNMGKSYMEQALWEKAAEQFNQVMAEDPFHEEARRRSKQAKSEQGMRRWFDEGMRKMEIGQDRDALERFFQIDQESSYYFRARSEVVALAKRLVPALKKDCQSYSKVKSWDLAARACAQAMDLTCHTKPDAEVQQLLKKAEKAQKGAGRREWVCRKDMAHWFTERKAAPGGAERAPLVARYKDPAVVSALALYVEEGLTGEALEALRKVRADAAKSAVHPAVDEVMGSLRLITVKYQEGNSAHVAQELREAEEAWQQMLEADEKIVPRGAKSFLNRQVRQMMGEDFARHGKTLFLQQRLADAYVAWEKGFRFDPANNQIWEGFTLLEDEAKRILAAEPSCSQVREVLKFTREKPQKSPARQEAERLQTVKGC